MGSTWHTDRHRATGRVWRELAGLRRQSSALGGLSGQRGRPRPRWRLSAIAGIPPTECTRSVGAVAGDRWRWQSARGNMPRSGRRRTQRSGQGRRSRLSICTPAVRPVPRFEGCPVTSRWACPGPRRPVDRDCEERGRPAFVRHGLRQGIRRIRCCLGRNDRRPSLLRAGFNVHRCHVESHS